MMAAPRAGEAAWNRLDVPRPACSATVAVPAEHPAVSCLSTVMKGCQAVSNMLTSTTVLTEQRLLHSIIYSFHHQMSHHRPYGTLKQVEQCLKRLNVMNLKKSIEDLVHVDPMILYRGLLKSLSVLYGSLFALHQEVSKIELKPYIKGFVFPAAINEFLGTSYSGIGKKIPKAFAKKKDRIGWMNKRFQASKAASCTQASVPSTVRKQAMDADDGVDIGKPVVFRRTIQGRGKELEFDVKSLCRHPNPVAEEGTKFTVKLPASKSLKSDHLASFVSNFREAHSFEELSDTLRSTISWCKSNKLGSKAFFLGMKLLKSRHLQHVEAQGCSLQRKLGCVKATICKYLMVSRCRQRPTQILRAGSCLQRHIRRSRKPRCSSRRTLFYTHPYQRGTHATKDMNGSFALSLARFFEHLPQVGNAESSRDIEEQAPGNASALLGLETTSALIQQEVSESKDDIDDIFGAIGL
ncbi:nucleolus and neural progenitor protein isoform X2 [Tiliqua scincoides]|uniref:nucleolus and neural progenitor protein isoform X2 n=1 Tax=Tiliqua scincoides TaxID=71010 RepID=UPI003462599D